MAVILFLLGVVRPTDQVRTAIGKIVTYIWFPRKGHAMLGHLGRYQGQSGGRRNEGKAWMMLFLCVVSLG